MIIDSAVNDSNRTGARPAHSTHQSCAHNVWYSVDQATAVDFDNARIVFWLRPVPAMGCEYARLTVLFHRVRGHWSEAGGLVTRSRRMCLDDDVAALADNEHKMD